MNALGLSTQTGLTLIETMFALAIVALLVGFAGNTFSAAINATRTGNGVASLVSALQLAHNNTMIAGVDVVLCPSNDGAACANGDHWEKGCIGSPPRT